MNTNEYVIYKHTSPNGKIYIGQTCTKPEKRWNKGKGYVGNTYFYNAIQKYGWDNFTHEIVLCGLTPKEANWLEKYLIRYYDSDNRDFGYNIRSGGDNSTFPEETKYKMSESQKDRGHWKGEKNYWFGKHRFGVDSPHKKPVLQFDKDGTFIKEFETVKYAESITGIDDSSIIKVCKGKLKTAGGYKWEYKTIKV